MRKTNHKRIVLALSITTIGMIIMHLTVHYRAQSLGLQSVLTLGGFDVDLLYWLSLDQEKHLGAMFSTALILLASALMAFAAWRTTPTKKIMALGWLMVAGVMLFMACDEYFSIHEHAGEFAGLETDGFGTQVIPIWVKAMAVVVAVLCIPMGLFWWTLPRGLRIRTALSAIIFLLGAAGMEVVSAAYVRHFVIGDFGYFALVAVEEGLEMLGILILIDAMLLHLVSPPNKAAGTEQLDQGKPTTALADASS